MQSRTCVLSTSQRSHIRTAGRPCISAVEMRHHPTPAEEAMWTAVRNGQIDGFKFRRQHHIQQYLADISCFKARLVIEIDGPIHETQRREDAERQRVIESFGYRVLRFT